MHEIVERYRLAQQITGALNGSRFDLLKNQVLSNGKVTELYLDPVRTMNRATFDSVCTLLGRGVIPNHLRRASYLDFCELTEHFEDLPGIRPVTVSVRAQLDAIAAENGLHRSDLEQAYMFDLDPADLRGKTHEVVRQSIGQRRDPWKIGALAYLTGSHEEAIREAYGRNWRSMRKFAIDLTKRIEEEELREYRCQFPVGTRVLFRYSARVHEGTIVKENKQGVSIRCDHEVEEGRFQQPVGYHAILKVLDQSAVSRET